MENRPLVGILVSRRKNRKKILELYQRHHNLNLKLYAFTQADILWKKQLINGLSLQKGVWKQSSFPFPNVIYNRCFNKELLTIQRLEKAIGKNKCFNNINFFNKWDVCDQLLKSDIKGYIPNTYLYTEVNVLELLEKYKLVFIKPIYGSKGNSVYRIERSNNDETRISLHSIDPIFICKSDEDVQKKLDEVIGLQTYLVQQGIHANQYLQHFFDIRALVQKNLLGKWDMSILTCRVAYENYYNTSICEAVCDVTEIFPQLFSEEEMNATLQSLKEVSIQAAQEAEARMGSLGELSVDFILDKQKKLWIVELNGKPQKSLYDDLKDCLEQKKAIYNRPLEYAYYLSQLKTDNE